MKTRHFILVAMPLLIIACNIPSLSDIHASSCLRQCSKDAKNDCKMDDDTTTSSSSGGADCFDAIEACFHTASDCSDACLVCGDNGTCDKDECNNSCVHVAEGCTDQIQPCLDSEKSELANKLTDDCVGPLMDCVSDCIADVENVLRGKKD